MGAQLQTKALKAAASLPAQQIVDAMFEDIDKHMDGGPMSDDQSLIATKVI